MTQLDDSLRRAAREPDKNENTWSNEDTLVRGLLARDHCRASATLEVVSTERGGTRLYRPVSVRVDDEPAQLLVGPWQDVQAEERGYIASVSGGEYTGRLLTVAVEFA